jgi:hypothetical protein
MEQPGGISQGANNQNVGPVSNIKTSIVAIHSAIFGIAGLLTLGLFILSDYFMSTLWDILAVFLLISPALGLIGWVLSIIGLFRITWLSGRLKGEGIAAIGFVINSSVLVGWILTMQRIASSSSW